MPNRHEILNDTLPTPGILSSRRETAKFLPMIENREIAVGSLELEKFKQANELFSLLQEPEMEEYVKDNYTFAMIKPEANDGKDPLHTFTDDEAEEFLYSKITERGFTPVFRLTYQFSHEDVEKFYAKAKHQLEKLTTRVKGEEMTVWENMTQFLENGPTTLLLLRKSEDDPREAWKAWRETIGNTRPNEADPQSLRGQYAIQEHLPNNLYHGSGNREEAYTEIKFFGKKVQDIYKNLKKSRREFPTEEELREERYLGECENLVIIEPVYSDRKLKSLSRYRLHFVDEQGRNLHRYAKIPTNDLEDRVGEKIEMIA